MKICYFGTYEKDYPRNRLLINALSFAGAEVSECHEPVWELTRDKTGDYLKPRSLIKTGFMLIRAHIRLLSGFMSINKPDLLMVGYIGTLDMLPARLLAYIRGIPLVFNPNISLYETLVTDRKIVRKNSFKAAVLRALDRLSFILADALIMDSRENAEYFRKSFKLGRKRLITAYTGADEEFFCPGETADSSSDDGSVEVLFFGKFIPLHGLDIILKAAKITEREGLKFTVAGSGQLSADINALKASLEPKNVTLTGWAEREELRGYVRRADICLGIFGDTEKALRVIPNKVYQVLASGKPLVTEDSPAVREILTNGKDAVFCGRGDPAALGNALLLLRNDRKLRAAVSENGYRTYRRSFSAPVTGKALLSELRNLTSYR
ncbi:MAG: glycosyltransferase [Elusimicrobia bacterium]|nr:glycosyltransferase [Elusimicrobiota bacterium]